MSSKETAQKTILVALLLCIVCSVIVSVMAVILRPMQETNKSLDKKHNILAVAGIEDNSKTVDALFAQITPKLVDLKGGQFTDLFELETYDMRAAAKDEDLSVSLTQEDDIASIKRHAKYATVYLIEDQGVIDRIILPVSGYGLWSTLHGFIALDADFNTVAGISFYEHSETPGLGGEVDNLAWKRSWIGKKVYRDDDLIPDLGLIKGKVNAASADAEWQIDGLAGATLTSNGVSNLIKFWLGENGFLPFLTNLKAGEA